MSAAAEGEDAGQDKHAKMLSRLTLARSIMSEGDDIETILSGSRSRDSCSSSRKGSECSRDSKERRTKLQKRKQARMARAAALIDNSFNATGTSTHCDEATDCSTKKVASDLLIPPAEELNMASPSEQRVPGLTLGESDHKKKSKKYEIKLVKQFPLGQACVSYLISF